MGLTKADLFTAEQNRLARLAKALAHPARIAIIEQLLQRNECVCGSLVDELGLAQATISQHLRELKDAGIIQGTVEGVRMCYCIDPQQWNELKTLFADLFDQYNAAKAIDCC